MRNTSYVIHVIIVFSFLQYVGLIVGVKIYSDSNSTDLTVIKNSTVKLNCISDEPIQWSFPKGSRNSNKKIENQISNGTYNNTLTIDPIFYSDTGYFICQSKNDSNSSAKIYVYCSDEKNPLVTTISKVEAAMYDRAEIPCKPTSPNINVSLTRSGTEVEPIEKYDPRIGYIISTYSMIDYTSFNCFAPGYKERWRITVNVHAPLNGSSNPYIEVTDSNFNYPIFEKQNVSLNCSIITSVNMGIKSLEWEFPKHVEKKIIIGNETEIRHKKFVGFFRILSIYNVSKNDRGNYTCKVIDDYSNTKISNHTLLVEDFNSIFLQVNIPDNSNLVTTRVGENSVKFIATVNSFPKHTSTWYDPWGKKIGDSNIFDKYDIINYAPEIELDINQVEIKNSGTYRLEVKNAWSIKTVNFTLIVEDKPGPIALKKVSGLHNLNFSYLPECIVTGYPLPQIRWSAMNCNDYPNCEDKTFQLIPISQHEEEAVEAYEVKSTLHFRPNDSMILRCEADNSLGSSNASSSFLLFDYGIGISIMRKNYKEPVTEGDNIELACAVSKYTYNNDFIWFFEKKEIVPSQEIRIKNSATAFSYVSTLSIANVQKNHTGKYSCHAPLSNSSFKNISYNLKNSSFPSLITVKDVKSPSVVLSNMNSGALHVVLGTSVKIMIQIDGNPLPSVVWYKNDEPLFFNDRITLKNYGYLNLNLNLTIGNVSWKDEGVYSFVATNKAGNVTDKLQLLILDSGTNSENTNYIFKFSIFVLILLGGISFWFMRNLSKEKKKLQKILKEYGLEVGKENAVPNFDTNLDIEEQTYLIPYNKKFEFPREKLEFGNVLGSGAFGIVKKATALGIIDEGVKTTVAIKVAKRSHDSLFVKYLVSELKIMIYLGQHPNVVNLLGACTKDLVKGEFAVIVEYCKYGNLRDFLLKQRNNFVNQITEKDRIDLTITSIVCYENILFHEKTRIQSEPESAFIEETPIGSDGYLMNNELYEPEWRSKLLPDYNDDVIIKPIKTVDLISWSLQAARGMEYLANRKILHGDLAARNILLAEENIVKISDFGLAKSMYQSEEYQSSKTVFPVKWMAIESIRDKVFSTQSDVWSFGVTIWELFSLGISPYPGLEHVTNLYEKLVAGYRLEKPKFATNQIYSLMKECWHHSPKSRPTFTELCEKLARLLDESTRSQYVELDDVKTAETSIDICDEENYLQILNSPICYGLNEDQVHQNGCNSISPNVIDNPTYLEIMEMSEKSTSPSNI